MTTQQAQSRAEVTLKMQPTAALCTLWNEAVKRSNTEDAAYRVITWIEEALLERNEAAFDKWMIQLAESANDDEDPTPYFI